MLISLNYYGYILSIVYIVFVLILLDCFKMSVVNVLFNRIFISLLEVREVEMLCDIFLYMNSIEYRCFIIISN